MRLPLALLLVLGLLAAWFLYGDDGDGAQEGVRPPAPGAAETGESAGATANALEAAESNPGAVSVERIDTGTVSGTAGIASLPPGEGRRVRVVDATGRGVAGAQVSWLTGALAEREREGWMTAADLESALAAGAYRTDAEGLVYVEAFGGDKILARAGEASGVVEINHYRGISETVLIAIATPRQVAVRTRGEDGARLAEIPVAIRQPAPRSGRTTLASAPTDASGDGRFLQLGDLDRRDDRTAALVAALRPPVAEPLPVAQEIEVELVVPAVGTVEVPVTTWDGRAAPDGTRVQLVSADAEREVDFRSEALADGVAEAFTVDGVARFPLVAVGGEPIRAAAFLYAEGTPSTADGIGPARAGELVVLPVAESADLPVLCGRLLDAAGAPLADRVVGMELRGGFDSKVTERSSALHPYSRTARIRTDQDGYFRHQPGGLQAMTVLLEMHLAFVDHGADGAVRGATAEVDPQWDGRGPYELGELRMEAAPVQVSGRVTAADGTPLEGARVTIAYSGPELTLTDAEGRFAILGPSFEGVRPVTVEHPRFRLWSRRVECGDELEVQLEQGFALGGRLLLDDFVGVERMDCGLFARPQERGAYAERMTVQGAIDPVDGSFSTARAPAGDWTLAFLHDDRIVHSIDGVTLAAGLAADPRLSEVDLRGLIHRYQLEVVAEDGSLIENAAVSRSDVESYFAHVEEEGGRAELLTVDAEVEMEVRAGKGYEPVVRSFTPGVHRVVLKAGPRVLLQLAYEPLPEGVQLDIAICREEEREDRTVLVQHAGERDFDGEGEFQLIGSGAWFLYCGLRHAPSGRRAIVDLGSGRFHKLDVRDSREVQTIRIRVSAAALADAVEAVLEDGGD